MEVARNLTHLNDLTVISNAINIISQLIQYKNLNLIIPGGYLRKNSLSGRTPGREESPKSLCR